MKLRDLILHNFRLKLFSVVVDCLIWETVHLSIKRQSANPAGFPAAQTNHIVR